jgi:hypothetical protein
MRGVRSADCRWMVARSPCYNLPFSLSCQEDLLCAGPRPLLGRTEAVGGPYRLPRLQAMPLPSAAVGGSKFRARWGDPSLAFLGRHVAAAPLNFGAAGVAGCRRRYSPNWWLRRAVRRCREDRTAARRGPDRSGARSVCLERVRKVLTSRSSRQLLKAAVLKAGDLREAPRRQFVKVARPLQTASV